MINGIVLRVDVTRKTSREKEYKTVIADENNKVSDENNNSADENDTFADDNNYNVDIVHQTNKLADDNNSNQEESGIDNGNIKIPVATDYEGICHDCLNKDPCNVAERGHILFPFHNKDIDCDYDYIMARALKSYRQHREKEKADSRKIQLRTNFLKRPYPRPKTAPPTRFTAAMRPPLLAKFPRPESALVPRSDAISEVHQANMTQEDIRHSKRVLQVATVNINRMMEMNNKTRSYIKRNEGAHCWYSNSYPDVKTVDNNMRLRAPHAYMSASVGERNLSSSLSSSRSSSTKSSPSRPSHAAGKPRGSVKAQYNYDGGLFSLPRNGPHDDFVIHPDWVSESMSIQKLSLSTRTPSKAGQSGTKDTRMTKSASWTLPGRRCKSAPPAKLRNPITWESKEG